MCNFRLPIRLLGGSLSLVLVYFLLACSEPSDRVSIVITGSSTVAPVVADAAKQFEQDNPDYRIDVQTGGSSRGITDAAEGRADLGMASRTLDESESSLTALTVAIDGVGLIVHRDNPLSDLGRDQAIDVYTGEIDNWKQLGGADAPIVVVSKAEGRATLEVFLGYLGIDSADVASDVIVGENQQAIKTVAGNPDAIGYVSIGAAASEAEAGTPIRLVSSDGIAATTGEVATGRFPITRPLNIILNGPPSAEVTPFLDYLRSPEIEDVVRSHLYVPVAR